MQAKFRQSKKEKREVARWVEGVGPVTPAIEEALRRNALTFGAALITREVSDGFKLN